MKAVGSARRTPYNGGDAVGTGACQVLYFTQAELATFVSGPV